MKKIIFWYVFIIVLLSLISIFINSFNYDEEPGLISVNVAFHNDYEGAIISTIEDKMHFFEKEGINIKNVSYCSNLFEIEAINMKEIQFGYINDISSINYSENNIKVIFFQNIGNSLSLITKKSYNINSISDLQNKKIAVLFGTSCQDYLNTLLKRINLEELSVSLINMDINGSIQALINDRCDAICVWGTYKYIVEEKLENNFKLLNESNLDSSNSINGWVVSDSYLNANKKTVRKFNIALSKTIDFWNQNEELCSEWVSDFLDIDSNIIYQEIGKYIILDSTNLKNFVNHKNKIKKFNLDDNSVIWDYMNSSIQKNILKEGEI